MYVVCEEHQQKDWQSAGQLSEHNLKNEVYQNVLQPFQQLGDALLSPLPPDVRADFGATFR